MNKRMRYEGRGEGLLKTGSRVTGGGAEQLLKKMEEGSRRGEEGSRGRKVEKDNELGEDRRREEVTTRMKVLRGNIRPVGL